MRRLAVLLLVLVLVAACGSDGDDDEGAPVTTTTSTTTVPAGCTPAEPEKVVPAPIQAPNLVPPRPSPARDRLGADETTAWVDRSDGRVTFARPGTSVSIQAWGDLDGDDRDELIVAAGGGPDSFVVPGTTKPGRYDPRAAGVRIDPQIAYPWEQDLDGRPGVDLVLPVRDGDDSHTDVWSGAAVVAKGPGGDARDLRPTRRLEGLTRAIVPLAEGAAPETLLLVPGDRAAITFASRPRARLAALGRSSRVEDVLVFDEGGVRKIGLQIDAQVAVWPVPPACR